MPKFRIPKNNKEKVLLTEVFPFELPVPFSNWGSYNYWSNLKKKYAQNEIPTLVRQIFKDGYKSQPWLIPWKFDIRKNSSSYRTLFLLHPGISKEIIDFYETNDLAIIRSCQKSNFSLRAPHQIAKSYRVKPDDITIALEPKTDLLSVDHDESDWPISIDSDINKDSPYASSYFKYRRYSYLYYFFESDEFTSLEKQFSMMFHLDIAKCFPSIYTHSISWAVEGKTWAKKRATFARGSTSPFAHRFDTLMQSCNYRETAGIPVGPEMSRIFAEIILQDVDNKVQVKLEAKPEQFKYGTNYSCCRYLDDYYLFTNSEDTYNIFKKTLRDELLHYNLYLNDDKQNGIQRPFIDQIGTTKTNVIRHIDGLKKLAEDLIAKETEGTISPRKVASELNNLRAIIQNQGDNIHAYSNVFLSSILKNIRKLSVEDRPTLQMNILLLFIEHFCHWLHLDTRVNSINFFIKLVGECVHKSNNLNAHHKTTISNRLYSEAISIFNRTLQTNSQMEAINLLSAFELLGEEYQIPSKYLDKLLKIAKSPNATPFNQSDHLSGIAILSIIRYIKNTDVYSTIFLECMEDAKIILRDQAPWLYAESAYLILDLVRCPYINKAMKNECIQLAYSHKYFDSSDDPILKPHQVGRIRNWIAGQDWYFDWGGKVGIKKMLKKKRNSVTY